MTDIVVRDAGTADIAALHRLIESAYRGEASRAGWTTEADLLDGQRTDPDDLAGILADPSQALLTAWRDGELLGCVLIADRGEGTGYFGMLSVSPTLPIGETLPFPYDDPRFGLPLRDDLHFIVMERPLA